MEQTQFENSEWKKCPHSVSNAYKVGPVNDGKGLRSAEKIGYNGWTTVIGNTPSRPMQ